MTMTEVVFLDSSVLFNLLEVPRKCSDRASVVDEFKQLAGDGATLDIPHDGGHRDRKRDRAVGRSFTTVP